MEGWKLGVKLKDVDRSDGWVALKSASVRLLNNCVRISTVDMCEDL